LQTIDGVEDIETDTAKLECRFRVTKPTVDYESKLVELAKTNTHLADYKIQ
jgi:hypothetical protein